MNIGEIIREVDTVWAPNNVTLKQKCAWLTQDLWQVLRKVRLPAVTATVPAVAGQNTYPLPDDCEPDLIRKFAVAGIDGTETEYRLYPHGQRVPAPWYRVEHTTTGVLVVLSDPLSDGESIVIEYVPRPAAFDEKELDAVPALPAEYHDYLVKKLAARCAKANAAVGGSDRDVLLANNYEMEAAEILEEMIKAYSPDRAVGFKMEANW